MAWKLLGCVRLFVLADALDDRLSAIDNHLFKELTFVVNADATKLDPIRISIFHGNFKSGNFSAPKKVEGLSSDQNVNTFLLCSERSTA